ncbi:outer membrane protein assembly factor BamD [Alphaproteobacteria bacterium]|nr:outer membrane protein assembly factor BamD [Alphaproteobacteria bacterium]
MEKGKYMRRYFLVLSSLLLVACSSKKDDLSKKNADDLYKRASSQMKEGEYSDAASDFKEIETLFPYSTKASTGQVLAAYCYFLGSNYHDAIRSIEIFLRYHPAHELVPYAMYLKAMCLYMQVSSIGRDAKAAKDAKAAFIELSNRFPGSIYHDDCLKRVLILDDIMAAHEMSVGRFYQKNGNALSAINRYNYVVAHFEHTKHCPEAYYRVMECCSSIGLAAEAAGAREALVHNFPKSEWSKKELTGVAGSQKTSPAS